MTERERLVRTVAKARAELLLRSESVARGVTIKTKPDGRMFIRFASGVGMHLSAEGFNRAVCRTRDDIILPMMMVS